MSDVRIVSPRETVIEVDAHAVPGRPGAVTPGLRVLHDGAVDAAGAAAGSASSAATSASEAVSSASSAATARTGAEAARGAAEAAADTAETAATVAVTAQGAAEGFAGDAETALTSTLAAAVYELRGTGQPGSTTETANAPVGTYYTDTAGTAGAWRWLKTATGSGSNKWTVVYGDTGWRDIGNLVTVGEAHPTQPTKIRRINNQIYFKLSREAVTIGVGYTLLSLPSGWYTGHGIERIYHMGAQGNAHLLFRVLGVPSGLVGSVQALGSGVENAAITLNANWATTAPWPTTLPGTPA